MLCYQQNSTHTYKRLFWPQLKSRPTVAEITKCCPKFFMPFLILKDLNIIWYVNCKSRLCLGRKSQKTMLMLNILMQSNHDLTKGTHIFGQNLTKRATLPWFFYQLAALVWDNFQPFNRVSGILITIFTTCTTVWVQTLLVWSRLVKVNSLGGIHKLRWQEEVGRSGVVQKMSTFCQLL